MVDIVTKEKRSRMMSGIKSKNTKPERLIRQGLHRRGMRFRLHDSRLPGRPDLYLPRFSAAIFIDGCFWHGHDCKYFKLPQTNEQFWKSKIQANKNRDSITRSQLENLGIRILAVWECETRTSMKEIEILLDKIEAWIKKVHSN